MMTDEHEEGQYGLIMPFVVCTSQGGPWDDQAFVAGVKLGVLLRYMDSDEGEISDYVHPDLVRQVDLAVMHFGYTMRSEPWDEYNTRIELTKRQDDGDE